jgi:hypothetical protein
MPDVEERLYMSTIPNQLTVIADKLDTLGRNSNGLMVGQEQVRF